MNNARELLTEALDELKAHLIIMQSELSSAEWSKTPKPWCKYCHQFDGHAGGCLIARIERELGAQEAQHA